VLLRASGDFVKAGAGLLLDQEGESIVRMTAQLSRDADRYSQMLMMRRQLMATAQATHTDAEVTEHATQLQALRDDWLGGSRGLLTDRARRWTELPRLRLSNFSGRLC
jgi:hypothetical protein